MFIVATPAVSPRHRPPFEGGKTFDGNRWNTRHYTDKAKQAGRAVVKKGA